MTQTARDLQDYLELPWTIVRETHNDDGTYEVYRVEELPGFAVAEGDYDLEVEFWNALANHIESYLEAGKKPPIPEGCKAVVRRVTVQGDTMVTVPSTGDSEGLPDEATAKYPFAFGAA